LATLIDPAQPTPIYFQLKTLLLEEILSGRYGVGGRLPTEHELCGLYGVSRTPVTRALSELAQDGVILRHRRRGTFVNPHWLQRQPDGRELRVVVPEGPWETMIRDAAPVGTRVSFGRVSLPDLHQTLTQAIAEGRGPDLAVLDSVWVAEFARAGFLRPLEELDREWIEQEVERDFVEPFVSANRVEGQTVAVQAEADVAGLWYRRSVLARLGLEPPKTWSELVAAGRTIAGSSNRRHAVVLPGGSPGGETTTYCLLAVLASNGASVLEAGSAVTLESDATVEALEFLHGLVDAGVVPTAAVSYEWDRPIRLLAQGRAAISFGGSYDGPALAAAAGLPAGRVWDEFGFVAMPAGPRGGSALAGGMVYGILRQAAYPELAMGLLEQLVSAESLAPMARATSQIPPRRSTLGLVPKPSPLLSATAAMLERAVVRPATAAYTRVSAQLQATLEAVLTGRVEPAPAVERAAELIAAITGLPVRRG
jgi:ABC-type glycerol-3-phosphate transport system substrate-binding protein/DNA-binding transcriptional regulator YhcF (GntR family)